MSTSRGRVAAIVILSVGAAGVLGLILSPVPIYGDPRTVYALVIRLHEAGWPYWITFAFLERTANVVLFIPVGALLAAVLPRRRQWIALLLVLLVTVGLESAQLLLAERRASVLDLALNTAGGAIGVGLTAGIRAMAHSRRVRRSAAAAAGKGTATPRWDDETSAAEAEDVPSTRRQMRERNARSSTG